MSANNLAELRRMAAQRTLARLMAASQQHLSPNKGKKQLADEIFHRLEARRLVELAD